ncbi:MAG TPA: Rid family hydrolase [Opitutaceae bacterium]|nr:Rid family hydrolase [Opitutaceae bacterium]
MPHSPLPLVPPSTVGAVTRPTAEFVVTIQSVPGESAENVFRRLAATLKDRNAIIVALFVFGDLTVREPSNAILRRCLGPIDWPVLWVDGASCCGAPLAGVQAFAMSGADVERVLVNGRIVGTVFDDGDARHCILAGAGPDDPTASREDQVLSTFENVGRALLVAGFEFSDVSRTWFYNDELLRWYGDFNRVRTGYYADVAFKIGASPASTGVAGRNPLDAALAMAAWAVQPERTPARVVAVASPLQCAATRYGSTFSRAVEIQSAHRRRLLVSGTASIAPGGESVWPGDIGRQIETTMDVVRAILSSRGMQFSQVTRATAYFKHAPDAAAFDAWQAANSVALPAVYVACDICRDDLLFEIEVDAVAT